MNYNIKIGSVANPIYEFDTDTIISIDRVTTVDLVTEELQIDEFRPHCFYIKYDAQSFAPKYYDLLKTADDKIFCTSKSFANDLRNLPYGTPVYFFKDNVLVAKYYSSKVKRITRREYEINCISAIGLLDNQMHTGGMYSGSTFEAVANSIIGGAIPFSCEEDVRTTLIYNWLPYATKRENLQQLMFATSATLTKDANGDIRFSYIYSASPLNIPDDRIYVGGDVDYGSPASKVQVSEHSFIQTASDEEVTLFDNTSTGETANNLLVVFDDAPIYNLKWNGSTFTGTGNCNYAIVNGSGVLTGKKYTHLTNIVEKSVLSDAEEKVVKVTDAYLVSVANSENVANRLMSYYSARKIIKTDIVLNDEQCGRKVAFTDAYDDEEQGYIYKMEVNSSSNEKASCEIITNYVPQGQGNAYTGSVTLTGNGTWTIPASVLAKATPSVKVVLVGGGQGGQSGGNGNNGESGSKSGNGNGGQGGTIGQGGSGGRIFVQVINVSGLTTLSYACGSGGAGGIANGLTPVNGSQGGATTITAGATTYTSANGQSNDNGYQNLFTAVVVARKGLANGIKGATGGKAGSSSAGNITYGGTTYYGGSNGSNSASYGSYQGLGGGGGGASVGNNGSNGGNGWAESGYSGGGGGGNGANATAREQVNIIGQGGFGGHSGGGGGGGGGALGGLGAYPASGGTGGSGGQGGQGGNGGIIIYY